MKIWRPTWRPKSLFVRIFLSFLLTIIATTLAIILIMPQQLESFLVSSAEQDMRIKMTSFVPDVARFLSGLPPYNIGPTVNILENLLGSKIYIANRNGYITVIGASFGNRLNLAARYVPESDLALLREGQTITRRETLQSGGTNTSPTQALTIVLPVMMSINNSNAIYLGSIYIQTPMASLSATALVARSQVASVPLISTLLALVMAAFISHTISRPLKMLNSAALHMAEGDYSVRIVSHAENEFSQLGSSFNLLATSLEESIRSLKDSKNRVENLIHALTEGVVATDASQNLLLFNPAAEQFLSLQAAEILGCPFRDVSLPEPLKQLLASQEPLPQSEVIVISGQLTLAVTTSPLCDELGNLSAQVAVLKDITEAHRLEQQRKEFVANVSHELRTPLTSIRGFVEAMLDQTIPPHENERYLNIIHQESVRLTRMIHELLDLSHIESGFLHLQPEEVELAPLVQSVILQAEITVERHDISFHVELDPPQPILLADPDRLEQILINLLTNAVKFTTGGGSILVRGFVSEKTQDKLQIEIQDSGSGIAEADLPYIWDRFFKADRSRSSRGTGLGLSIVRSLIEAHQETIWVENRPPLGACFCFTMPLRRKV